MASPIFEENDDDELIAQINVVPFVDIVLVLLIVFMLTSSLIARASISVNLPRAAGAGEAAVSTINVTLDTSGQLILNGSPMTYQTLGTYIARASWKEDNLQAIISADKKVDYGEVIKVIDIIRTNGIKEFALNIEREN